jgi:hypothetical protein
LERFSEQNQRTRLPGEFVYVNHYPPLNRLGTFSPQSTG